MPRRGVEHDPKPERSDELETPVVDGLAAALAAELLAWTRGAGRVLQTARRPATVAKNATPGERPNLLMYRYR